MIHAIYIYIYIHICISFPLEIPIRRFPFHMEPYDKFRTSLNKTAHLIFRIICAGSLRARVPAPEGGQGSEALSRARVAASVPAWHLTTGNLHGQFTAVFPVPIGWGNPFELPSSGPHFALGRLAAAACRLAGCVANANDSTSDNNVILYDATTTTTTTTSTTTSTTTTTNDNKDNNNDNSDNSSWRRSLEHHMQSDMPGPSASRRSGAPRADRRGLISEGFLGPPHYKPIYPYLALFM